MKPIDIEKHTKSSLEFIFCEADKMASEILKSLSENINKSFLLVAFHTSIVSYAFFQVIENDYMYGVLMIGEVISISLLHRNLFPSTIIVKGSLPQNMIHKYFEGFSDENLEKEYLATQIQNYNKAIIHNEAIIVKLVVRFKRSIYCLIMTLALFLLGICSFSSAECLEFGRGIRSLCGF